MGKIYRFGPVLVQFRDLPRYPNWPFWSWKLDPFQTVDGIPDITIGYCPDAVKPIGTPVWADNAAGREIYLQKDGTLLWQQTEPEHGQLLLQFAVNLPVNERRQNKCTGVRDRLGQNNTVKADKMVQNQQRVLQ